MKDNLVRRKVKSKPIKTPYRYYVEPIGGHTNKVVADMLKNTNEVISEKTCLFGGKPSRRFVWEVSKKQVDALKNTSNLEFNIFESTNRSRKPHFIGTNSSKKVLGVKEKSDEILTQIDKKD